MNKELEEAIKILDNLKNVLETGMCKFGYNIDMGKDTGYIEAIETTLNYIENSIPKEKVEEKIKELDKRAEKYREYTELGIETDIEWIDNIADRETMKVLKELMEGK